MNALEYSRNMTNKPYGDIIDGGENTSRCKLTFHTSLRNVMHYALPTTKYLIFDVIHQSCDIPPGDFYDLPVLYSQSWFMILRQFMIELLWLAYKMSKLTMQCVRVFGAIVSIIVMYLRIYVTCTLWVEPYIVYRHASTWILMSDP